MIIGRGINVGNGLSFRPSPRYAFDSYPTSINEGATGEWVVRTTNVPNGTTLYWSLQKKSGDFVASSGSFTITDNLGSFSISPELDLQTEGTEYYTVHIENAKYIVVLRSPDLVTSINDTSLSIVAPTYTVTPEALNVNEGLPITFNVSGEGIDDGTYYWSASSAKQFSINSMKSGSFIIANNAGSFTVIPGDDGVGGTDSFVGTIRARQDGPVLANSSLITINDAICKATPYNRLVNEGSSLNFRVFGKNLNDGTYYWTRRNFSNSEIEDLESTSGSFVVTNKLGSFNVAVTEDNLAEVRQSFQVLIRSDSTSGSVIGYSPAVGINPAGTYNISIVPQAYANNINEGTSLYISIRATGVSDGTYYWTTTNSGDFATSSGSFLIANGMGTFIVTPEADLTTEGPETFTILIRSDSITGTILANSSTIAINDTSTTPPPTYTVTPAASSVNEGSSLTFNVSGERITDGTYYWTITNSGDFGTSSGSFTITSNSGSFNVTPTADTTTEGAETFTASIRSVSISGTILATSSSVTINDTSVTPATYAVTPVASSVNEGSSLTFNVSGTNIINGTYYWTVSNSGDFATNSGSFTITSNSGSFSVTPTADGTTEGVETFTASIRSGSTTGTTLATSSTVTINDTSTSTNNELWSWGGEESPPNGALGLNDGNSRSSPTQVGTEITWSRVSAETRNSLGIKSNGTLWSWGQNFYGSLGLNNVVDRSSPTQVGTLTNWSKIDDGLNHVTAIKTDGTLWSWGWNGNGQLGENDLVTRSSPVQVGTESWLEISAGFLNTAAIKTDGTLWTWGVNTSGQLGRNNTISESSPVQVGTGTNWSKIAVGQYSAFAIKTNGTMWSWGENYLGQLGQSNVTYRSSPVQIGTGTDWSKITSYGPVSFAIKTDGTLWSWGLNDSGQLGLGDTTNRNSPVQVGTGTNWSQTSTWYNNVAAIKTDGTLWTWGINASGQLGLGDTVSKSSPVQVGSLTTWHQSVAAFNRVLALKIPPPTYTVTPAASSVNEGNSLTFTVGGERITDGTYYWTITNSGDFGTSSGSFTITSNSGSFNVTPTADTTTEGSETFTASIRTGSTSGTVVATSSSVTINDTSISPMIGTFNPGYGVTSNGPVGTGTGAEEGNNYNWTVYGTGIPNGSLFYWTIRNYDTSSADFQSSSGTFYMNNNEGSFTTTAIFDSTTEPGESYEIQIRTDSINGPIVKTIGTFQIISNNT